MDNKAFEEAKEILKNAYPQFIIFAADETGEVMQTINAGIATIAWCGAVLLHSSVQPPAQAAAK